MLNSLDVHVVTELPASLNYLGFLITVNLRQDGMVLLVSILMATETRGLRVWRRLKHFLTKAICN